MGMDSPWALEQKGYTFLEQMTPNDAFYKDNT